MTKRCRPDHIVAEWHRRTLAGETSTQIAADYPGITRGAVLGAIHRYRLKLNGAPAGPPQRRKRAEAMPRQIVTDKERWALYAGQIYDKIDREFVDNAPLVRELALAREVASVLNAV